MIYSKFGKVTLQQKKDSTTVENLRTKLAKQFDLTESRNMDDDMKSSLTFTVPSIKKIRSEMTS